MNEGNRVEVEKKIINSVILKGKENNHLFHTDITD